MHQQSQRPPPRSAGLLALARIRAGAGLPPVAEASEATERPDDGLPPPILPPPPVDDPARHVEAGDNPVARPDPPREPVEQHVQLGSAMRSTGGAENFLIGASPALSAAPSQGRSWFNGDIDEALERFAQATGIASNAQIMTLTQNEIETHFVRQDISSSDRNLIRRFVFELSGPQHSSNPYAGTGAYRHHTPGGSRRESTPSQEGLTPRPPAAGGAFAPLAQEAMAAEPLPRAEGLPAGAAPVQTPVQPAVQERARSPVDYSPLPPDTPVEREDEETRRIEEENERQRTALEAEAAYARNQRRAASAVRQQAAIAERNRIAAQARETHEANMRSLEEAAIVENHNRIVAAAGQRQMTIEAYMQMMETQTRGQAHSGGYLRADRTLGSADNNEASGRRIPRFDQPPHPRAAVVLDDEYLGRANSFVGHELPPSDPNDPLSAGQRGLGVAEERTRDHTQLLTDRLGDVGLNTRIAQGTLPSQLQHVQGGQIDAMPGGSRVPLPRFATSQQRQYGPTPSTGYQPPVQRAPDYVSAAATGTGQDNLDHADRYGHDPISAGAQVGGGGHAQGQSARPHPVSGISYQNTVIDNLQLQDTNPRPGLLVPDGNPLDAPWANPRRGPVAVNASCPDIQVGTEDINHGRPGLAGLMSSPGASGNADDGGAQGQGGSGRAPPPGYNPIYGAHGSGQPGGSPHPTGTSQGGLPGPGGYPGPGGGAPPDAPDDPSNPPDPALEALSAKASLPIWKGTIPDLKPPPPPIDNDPRANMVTLRHFWPRFRDWMGGVWGTPGSNIAEWVRDRSSWMLIQHRRRLVMKRSRLSSGNITLADVPLGRTFDGMETFFCNQMAGKAILGLQGGGGKLARIQSMMHEHEKYATDGTYRLIAIGFCLRKLYDPTTPSDLDAIKAWVCTPKATTRLGLELWWETLDFVVQMLGSIETRPIERGLELLIAAWGAQDVLTHSGKFELRDQSRFLTLDDWSGDWNRVGHAYQMLLSLIDAFPNVTFKAGRARSRVTKGSALLTVTYGDLDGTTVGDLAQGYWLEGDNEAPTANLHQEERRWISHWTQSNAITGSCDDTLAAQFAAQEYETTGAAHAAQAAADAEATASASYHDPRPTAPPSAIANAAYKGAKGKGDGGKGKPKGKGKGEAPRYVARPGDWKCPDSNCGCNNFAHRQVCFKCQKPRPTGAVGASNWPEGYPPEDYPDELWSEWLAHTAHVAAKRGKKGARKGRANAVSEGDASSAGVPASSPSNM
ncbi:MAG: hypothetical protein OSB03_02305 [Vicinamibacterales bacterium]|nr:hypothetical protein [Vicinamibacterales bacterium]